MMYHNIVLLSFFKPEKINIKICKHKMQKRKRYEQPGILLVGKGTELVQCLQIP